MITIQFKGGEPYDSNDETRFPAVPVLLLPWKTDHGQLAVDKYHVPFGQSCAFVTLDFVRQISLESFLGIWLGIFLCMAIPYVLPCGRSRIHFSLTPSVLMYIATLMIKETFIL